LSEYTKNPNAIITIATNSNLFTTAINIVSLSREHRNRAAVPLNATKRNSPKRKDMRLLFKCQNSILYTKVEKFMIIARAPRLEPEARRGL
jgi:hypothetical protein